MSARVAITGGAGFLGTALARRLLAAPLSIGGGPSAELSDLVLLDLVGPQPDLAADPRVTGVVGDLSHTLGAIGTVDIVFHLAGVVSSAAEQYFDLGMTTNIDGTRAVLEHARRQPNSPVVVFASSLAVFGTDPAIGPIPTVDDDTLPRPQSSYGIQKFIGEQLVADYSRKGFLRGRLVRLMTVTVRPGKPNAAASSILSGVIREPLAGVAADCPVAPDTPIALSSPRRTLDGLLCAAESDDSAWGSRTAMNLPALTTSPLEMAAALDRVAGTGTSDLINWTDNPAIRGIVASWPARFHTPRAQRLGLEPDQSFEQIIEEYLHEIGDTRTE